MDRDQHRPSPTSGPGAGPPPPELTVRAVVTGMVIGALLTPCNVYSGLRIGWTFNMSVASGLLALAFWNAATRFGGARQLHLHENNINQTSASAAASIVSAGLAAPIPALTLLTGQTLGYWVLTIWMFVISLLGVVVAAGLRNQLLHRENLPFPHGVVTAATMREIHGVPEEGAEPDRNGPAAGSRAGASDRLRTLLAAAAAGALAKLATIKFALAPWAPPFAWPFSGLAGRSGGPTAMNLGFALDPSALMLGFGAIAGLRVGLSALAGAFVAWGVLGPLALSRGWAQPGAGADASWFAPLVEWLLWPGATLMVVAALTSFALSLGPGLRNWLRNWLRAGLNGSLRLRAPPALTGAVLAVLVLAVAAQNLIFSIGLVEAVVAVLLTYGLAVVAARVAGETGITPVGALGKITQLTFGALAPGNVTANLMTANVTGGAAGQCADLMHDLRTGQLIGATPRFQIVAQCFGLLAGAFAAALAYQVLIPDPVGQLITPEWPAPAVATWKAVAEVLSQGLGALPTGSVAAMAIAAAAGIAAPLMEARGPQSWRPWIPSASAAGLGFVIPAWNSISLFLGALAAAAIARAFPHWGRRNLVIVAAGLIVGESLTGILDAISSAVR